MALRSMLYMLPHTFTLVHAPSEYDSKTFGTNSEGKKVLVLYNLRTSLHIDLTPLSDFENVRKGFANFGLAYFVGKKLKASTILRGAILPTSYDKALITVTIPIRQPIVFTVREPRLLMDKE